MKASRIDSPTKSRRISPSKRQANCQKIEHEIENGGCKCALCQRLMLEKMRVVRDDVPPEMQLEKRDIQTRLTAQPYYLKYLCHFYAMDRAKRRVRLLLPEICVFEKGFPIYMLSKRKEFLPLRMIKNKQKLNFYEVKNFFLEGFLYHNRQLEATRGKSFSRGGVLESKDREAMKNECIAIARFTNNPGQILSFSMLDNLFKSNQRNYRTSLLYMQTLVGSSHYEEIRVRVDLSKLKSDLTTHYQRAKNETRVVNCQIKPNEAGFISEKEQYEFEQQLKRLNHRKYLQYSGLKLILLHSFTSEKALEQSTIRFAKGSTNGQYYFIDLQVHRFCEREDIWGIQIVEQKIHIDLEERLRQQQLEAKFSHLSEHVNTKNIEKAMQQDYTQAKQHYLGKPLKRLVHTQASYSDALNLENVAPERHFRIVRNASQRRPPTSKFH